MGYFLMIIGFLGVPVCFVVLLVRWIRKKSIKPVALAMAGLFICFVMGVIIIPKTTSEEAAAPKIEQQLETERQLQEESDEEEARHLADEQAAAEKENAEQEAAQKAEEERSATEEQAKIDRESFISGCEEINYKDLMRNPDDYNGKDIVITVKITQIMQSSWLDSDTVYHCYSDTSGYGLYYDDEYYVVDDRIDKDLKLLEDDIIKVYGKFDGVETITRAIGWTQSEVPRIMLKYVELIEE